MKMIDKTLNKNGKASAKSASGAREIRIVAFPKEFQKDYWAQLDKRMLSIFIISLVVLYTPLIYVSTRPKSAVQQINNSVLLKIAKVNKVSADLIENVEKEQKQEEDTKAAATAVNQIRSSGPVNQAQKAGRQAQAKAAAAARAGAAQKAAAGRGVLAVATATGGRGGGRYAESTFSGSSSGLDNVLGQIGSLGTDDGSGDGRTVLGSGGAGSSAGGLGDLNSLLGDGGSVSAVAGTAGGGLIGLTKATISGGGGGAGASAADIQSVIDAQATAVNSCYQKELKKSPDLKGKLSVSIKINQAGKVAGVTPTQNTVGDAVGQCVVNKIRGWSFPRGKKGVITVNQTFVFTK